MARLDLDKLFNSPPPKASWIIKDLVSSGQMITFGGEAAIGKSIFGYHLSMCISSGKSFLGKDTRSGNVVIFDEENGRPELGRYLWDAWDGLKRPDIATLGVRMRVESFSLATEKDPYVAMRTIVAEHKPILIIIDTVTPVCRLLNENDNAEATAAIQKLRSVKAEGDPDAAMLMLKHTKKDDYGNIILRGAKAWVGASDGMWIHHAKGGRKRRDGLRNTFINPEKVRAYGLPYEIKIMPERTSRGGLVLHCDWVPASDEFDK
ncbi:hypothetical protein LCGC14_1826000 [marine sediment metagenome]|uniref:AAA+ ATPase domain-containing protein n=1 Tax=marine sediment metagenome TaxID=412755 RepID=A0A0F9IX75_9ZZZZ